MPQFQWLEEVQSERALAFAKEQSDRTLHRLVNLPYFSQMQKEAEAVISNPKRVPMPDKMFGGYIYNVWQDDQHVQGLWRRAKVENYFSDQPVWEILLDLDQLSKSENIKWVWKEAIYNKDNMRALVFLSNGGEDAKEIREYDLVEKKFVQGGFFIPRSKSYVSWYDANTIFYSPAFDPSELTSSDYPRTVRRLQRGELLNDAKLILEGESTDWGVYGSSFSDEKQKIHLVARGFGMNETRQYILDDKDIPHQLSLPEVGFVQGLFKGRIVFVLEAPWEIKHNKYSAGSLLALSLVDNQIDLENIEVLYEGQFGRAVVSAAVAKDIIWVDILENIQTHIVKYVLVDDKWQTEKLDLPEMGTCSFAAIDEKNNVVLIAYQNFTQPRSYYLANAKGITLLREESSNYDASEVEVSQFWTTSKDGTKIPYFYIAKQSPKKTMATIVNGYGGYNISKVPYYLNETGKLWVEQGGAWVVANIRGGGELGPEWHLSAIQKNKQKSYDDFIAIAQDLIDRGLTTPAQLGIFGGSNGGLLVGAAFTQRPDLYNAVVCSVPLLDMLRFHKLPPGASWICEYGNPDEPEFAEVISRYSPYHNLAADKKYPEVFFNTSTKDDRVHPGHARKMVAKMASLGHPVLYFENQEGGHAGAANLKQRAYLRALEFSYFRDKLMGEKKQK